MTVRSPFLDTSEKVDLTSMIDVVFLLLAFFMVTTVLTVESDLSLKLPAPPVETPVTQPAEHIVDILPSGAIQLNGATLDDAVSADLPELVKTLKRLKIAAESTGQETAVTIVADPDSLHARSIAVLNACAAAGVKLVMFAQQ